MKPNSRNSARRAVHYIPFMRVVGYWQPARLILACCFALLATSISTRNAEAWSCADPAPHESFEAADLVFIGRVIGRSRDGVWHRFRVSRAWKGTESRDVWITHQGARDYPPWPLGPDLLVFALNAEAGGSRDYWVSREDFPKQHVLETGVLNSGLFGWGPESKRPIPDRTFTVTCSDPWMPWPDELEFLDSMPEISLDGPRPGLAPLGLVFLVPDIVFYIRWFFAGIPGGVSILIGLIALLVVWNLRR